MNEPIHPLLNFWFSTEAIILSKGIAWAEEDFGTRIDVKVSTTYRRSSSCVSSIARLEFSLAVAPLVSWIDSSRNPFDPMHDSVSHATITAARRRRRP